MAAKGLRHSKSARDVWVQAPRAWVEEPRPRSPTRHLSEASDDYEARCKTTQFGRDCYWTYLCVREPPHFAFGILVHTDDQKDMVLSRPPDRQHPYYVRMFLRMDSEADQQLSATWNTQEEFDALVREGKRSNRPVWEHTLF